MTKETTYTKPARRLPRGVLPIAGILAMVALLVFVFNGRFGQDPRLVDSPLIGRPISRPQGTLRGPARSTRIEADWFGGLSQLYLVHSASLSRGLFSPWPTQPLRRLPRSPPRRIR